VSDNQNDIIERTNLVKELGNLRSELGRSVLLVSLLWHNDACELDNRGDLVGYVGFVVMMYKMLCDSPQTLIDLNLVDADQVEHLKFLAEESISRLT
jgi:hypothetical protein